MLKQVEIKKESIHSKAEQLKIGSTLMELVLEQQMIITELLKLKIQPTMIF